MFINFPREIRDTIYGHVISLDRWGVDNIDDIDKFDFTGSLGDPSGFYFSLRKSLPVLGINGQTRRETLPLTYTRTNFHLDDMDDVVKLLIAVGHVGRENIESLEFPWQSRSDSECKWDKYPDSEDHFMMLPTLHVTQCIQLLKECKKLKSLVLFFENELIANIAPDTFKSDPGILELSSIRNIERVEICSLAYEPFEHCRLAQWLREEMGASNEAGTYDEENVEILFEAHWRAENKREQKHISK